MYAVNKHKCTQVHLLSANQAKDLGGQAGASRVYGGVDRCHPITISMHSCSHKNDSSGDSANAGAVDERAWDRPSETECSVVAVTSKVFMF